MSDLGSKTISNMEKLRQANVDLQSTIPHGEIEKQRLTVASSLARCRRCGDFAPAFPVAAALTTLCSVCEIELKERDGCMWFADMVAAILGSKKS